MNLLIVAFTSSGRTSQTKLLAGAVVKKRSCELQDISPKRQKTEVESDFTNSGEKKIDSDRQLDTSKRPRTESESKESFWFYNLKITVYNILDFC